MIGSRGITGSGRSRSRVTGPRGMRSGDIWTLNLPAEPRMATRRQTRAASISTERPHPHHLALRLLLCLEVLHRHPAWATTSGALLVVCGTPVVAILFLGGTVAIKVVLPSPKCWVPAAEKLSHHRPHVCMQAGPGILHFGSISSLSAPRYTTALHAPGRPFEKRNPHVEALDLTTHITLTRSLP